jgi:cytochrome c5
MKSILFSRWLMGAVLAFTGACALAASGAAPDVGAGKKRAAVCFACHGPDGISKIPGTPHLAGQERSYLEGAIRAYRDGQTRVNATMNAMAKPLSDRDVSNIAAYFSLQTRMDKGQTAAQVMETIERIKAVGSAAVEQPVTQAAAAPVARSGEAVYNGTCMACHGTGAAGAPKMGDKAAWAPRLAQGAATLLKHALEGYKGMPPKGGCVDCSGDDIKAAVSYLADKSK